MLPFLVMFEVIPGMSVLKPPFTSSTLLKPAETGDRGVLADAGAGKVASSSVSDGSAGEWGKDEERGAEIVDGVTDSWRRSCTSGRSTTR